MAYAPDVGLTASATRLGRRTLETLTYWNAFKQLKPWANSLS